MKGWSPGEHIDTAVTDSAAVQDRNSETAVVTLQVCARHNAVLLFNSLSVCVCVCLRMCWVYNVTGVWVYPLLEHIDTVARALFFICLTTLTSLYYIMGEILNNYIWDSSTSKCVSVCV